MNEPLTPSEYFTLNDILSTCLEIMNDPYLLKNTNVLTIHNLIWERIKLETDTCLDHEIYTIPFINKPV